MAKMFKKIFAMMLVMCMLVGMLPMQALAEESIPAAVEGLDVTVTVDEETNTIVVEIASTDKTIEWDSQLTQGENIETNVSDVESSTEATEEGTVVTDTVTVVTGGNISDNVTVKGEETYTETSTTTETTVTIQGVVEGNETVTVDKDDITPEDEDLPEVVVPALPTDDELKGGEKDVVVEYEEDVVKTGTYKTYDVVDTNSTTVTTTKENVTVTDNNKVVEDNKTVETTTTTVIDKTTVENFDYSGTELRDANGNVIQRQDVYEDKDTVITVNTTVKVTETTNETIGDVKEDENDTEYDYTDIQTTIDREVKTEIEVNVDDESSFNMDQIIAPEDYEGKNYDNPGKITGFNQPTGLLNSTNPDSKAPGEKPEEEGYDYVISGSGDATWAAAPVCMDIVYLRDENGNPIPDPENPGSFLIDQEKSTLVYSGDKAGYSGMNSTPGMIVVKSEDGELFYTYCIDKDTPTADGSWYKITNLEDSDYYPDDASAAMLRAIVTNGYWGTDANVYEVDENGNLLVDEEGKLIAKKDEEGNIIVDETVTGSLAKIKALMRETYDETATVTVKDAKGNEHTYNIVDLIDDLKEHEALAVTQAAIWSYSNGALATKNGEDGIAIIGVMSAKKFFNGKNQDSPLNQYAPVYNLESDARLQALYDLFMNLEPMSNEGSSTVINDTNFVDDVHITIGDKAEHEDNYDEDDTNDVYESELNFTLAFVPDSETDDLLVYLLDAEGNKITDKDGKPIIKRLAGENSEGEDHETITPDANGVYTLSGLQLSENSDFKFDLKLEGTQLLKDGVYVYTSNGGRGHSQTLVGLASGTQNVDVSASMTISFNVDESKTVVATRHWRCENDPYTEEVPQDPPRNYRYTPNTDTIVEEPVPLADVPQTGDNSVLWFAMILLSGLGLCVIEMSNKKCKA